MNETVQTIVASPVEREAPKPVQDPIRRAPTREERLQLIGALQAEALAQPDPLAANLGAMNGDLMLFAYRIREAMQEMGPDALTSGDRFQDFAAQADLYLKFARQIDRLAQLARQGQEGKGQARQGG